MTIETQGRARPLLAAPLLDDNAGDVAALGDRVLPRPRSAASQLPERRLAHRWVANSIRALATAAVAALTIAIVLASDSDNRRPAPAAAMRSANDTVDELAGSPGSSLKRASPETLVRRRKRLQITRHAPAHRRAAQRPLASRRRGPARRASTIRRAEAATRPATRASILPAPRRVMRSPPHHEEFPF
jgi:hypothetical protein